MLPVALAMALAIAAIGGQMPTSPTPLDAKRVILVRHFNQHRLDHWYVGSDRHPIVQEAGILQAPVLTVDVPR